MTESGTLWIVQNVGKGTCPAAVVLVEICRHATRDVAIFLRPAKSTGANRSLSLLSKNYQSRWNPRENVNTIGTLWSVNLQRCIIITLSGNCCFLSLMARYCPRKSNMFYTTNAIRNGKLNTKKSGRFVFVPMFGM
jgi:hypothetical protein